jgi:hypothetical protein
MLVKPRRAADELIWRSGGREWKKIFITRQKFLVILKGWPLLAGCYLILCRNVRNHELRQSAFPHELMLDRPRCAMAARSLLCGLPCARRIQAPIRRACIARGLPL